MQASKFPNASPTYVAMLENETSVIMVVTSLLMTLLMMVLKRETAQIMILRALGLS